MSDSFKDAFAKEKSIPKAYDSYEKLADDPEVEVIYIGTPHPFHYANTKMCFEKGNFSKVMI